MTKKKKFKVAFDLDGVVYDFIGPLDRWMMDNGFSVEDKSSYNLHTRYGTTEEIGKDAMNEFGEQRPFLTIPLVNRAKQEMDTLSKNHELYIITYRTWTPYGINDTLDRIKRDKLPVNNENIIFSEKKGDCARVLGIELFYEDSGENAIDITRKSKSLVALIDTDYNKDVKGDRIIRTKW